MKNVIYLFIINILTVSPNFSYSLQQIYTSFSCFSETKVDKRNKQINYRYSTLINNNQI